jgi:Ser/Thr protein kinase RdoA (MazF antagonist)
MMPERACFGYNIYDLSLAVEHCQEAERLPLFREALLEGYNELRSFRLVEQYNS